MKKLEDITNDELIYIDMGGYSDPVIITKEDLLTDKYFKDKQFKLFTVQTVRAMFSLYEAIQWLENDMYEGWLDDVINDIPKEVVRKIDIEVNEYLKDKPTYYPKERVEW